MVVILEPREHFDIDTLPPELAAELGPLMQRVERAVRAVGRGIGRVHICRWGDGSEHLHWWFMARPARVPQLIGSFAAIWDDILPPLPEDVWQANVDAGRSRHAVKRVNVKGKSGSGKSTFGVALGQRLDLPYVELDELHRGPNWTEATDEDFLAHVREAMDAAPQGWVIDGNYEVKLGDIVIEAADTIVWLDLPFRVSRAVSGDEGADGSTTTSSCGTATRRAGAARSGAGTRSSGGWCAGISATGASGRTASRAIRASSACALSPRRGPGWRPTRPSSRSDTCRHMAEAAPSGTVTLVFSDIEGSTRVLQRSGDSYAELLAMHRDLIREAFARHHGFEVDMQGDAFFVTFASASDAAAAAADAQRALASHDWPDENEIRVRMGLHTGEPRLIGDRYVGIDVHHGARVMAAGHGGQVLLSESTRALLDDRVRLRDLGEHRLKDLTGPQHLYQLEIEGLPAEFPPLNTLDSRPTNLPALPSAFIGRARELAEVEELLSREDLRLLTLTGTGGAGKTRLALQVAAEAIERFQNGVFFVSLSPVRDWELVVPTIAADARPARVPGRDDARDARGVRQRQGAAVAARQPRARGGRCARDLRAAPLRPGAARPGNEQDTAAPLGRAHLCRPAPGAPERKWSGLGGVRGGQALHRESTRSGGGFRADG